MSNYCTTSMCLRKYILNYFGQETEEHCGNCSNCLEEFVELDVGEIAAGRDRVCARIQTEIRYDNDPFHTGGSEYSENQKCRDE